MNKKQKALLAFQIFCAFVLAFLPFVDQSRIERHAEDGLRKHLYIFVYTYNLWIAVICGLIVAVIPAIKDIYYPRQQHKIMRRKIMETMMQDLFGNNMGSVRITVFRDANMFRHALIYAKLLLENLKSNVWKLPRKGKYIYIKERLGTEFTESKTFFYYSPETRKKCQGVAGVVRQSLEEIVVKNLPDIETIDLSTVNIKSRKSSDSKKVLEYMDNGHVRDLETLKRIHVRAKHFYGNILQNSDGTPKGVLVIDSTLPECAFEDPSVMEKLSNYLTLFTPTM